MLWSRKTLRTVPLLAAAGLSGSCSYFGSSDIESIYLATKQAWAGGNKVTLQEAAAVSYASVGMRLSDRSQIMLLLASDQNGELLWTSAERMAIKTRDGRIVGTAGFKYNLGGYTSLNRTAADRTTEVIRWQGDFPDLGLFGIPIECRDRFVGDETIVILGKDIQTRRMEEDCESQSSLLDWSFTNIYWLDPASHLAWRSVQHVNPKLDPIEIEVLRPPA